MHEGTINVSTKLGSGSSFTVILPIAGSVFESVYEDAKTGIISEKPYFRSAAEFIALQAVEAARSMGYEDVEKIADEFETVPLGESTLKDQKTVELLKAFGDDRYTDLVDELTFIEPDMLDEAFDVIENSEDRDDVLFEEESAEVKPEAAVAEEIAEVLEEHEEPVEEVHVETEEERLAREDRERREEAKAILTQQILPRAVPNKPVVTSAADQNVSRRQAVTVHPETSEVKKSAPRKKKKGSLFLDLTASSEDNSGAQIQSAVRQVLDETEGK